MNIITKLLDQDYVQRLFEKKALPLYPAAISLSVKAIKPIKKNIWHTTYHVVFRYDVDLALADGGNRRIEIYCSAHSSEPRRNVHEALAYLWRHDFGAGELTIPRPLFYVKRFNAAFYEGVEGENLYSAIRRGDRALVERLLPRTAAWFAKLHQLPAGRSKLFDQPNGRLATVLPGAERILSEVRERYPDRVELHEQYRAFYRHFIDKEEAFLARSRRQWLVHGDAHPENIIAMGDGRLAAIDFADLARGDFARDLGSFTQQLEYMIVRKLADADFAAQAKRLFLDSYLAERGLTLDSDLEERIKLYYDWTTIRTASFFLLKHDSQPERAEPLIAQVAASLALKQ